MAMGMGFPSPVGIQWESHGNGNKTPVGECELGGMRKRVDGNGNDPTSHGKIPTDFVVAVEVQ